jgi:hypothetical protein
MFPFAAILDEDADGVALRLCVVPKQKDGADAPPRLITEAPALSHIRRASLALLDRAIAWLQCYLEFKGHALPPPPVGTCTELYLLVSQFQLIQGLLREGLEDLSRSPVFLAVEARFHALCPPPSPNGTPTPTCEATLRWPLAHALEWHPLHIDPEIYRQLRSEINEARHLEVAAQSWACHLAAP